VEIFKLFGSVLLQGGDTAGKQLDDIDKKGESAGNKLSDMGGKVAAAGTAIVTGIAAAGTALLGFATKSSDSASRVSDLSQKLGMSTTAFQEWDFILSQNGASIDSMTVSMKALADRAVEGSDAYEKLGIKVKNNDGTMKSQQQLFKETVTALQGMTNKTERAALANDLLGKGATELGPLLNAGAASVDDLRNKAHELGLVMSEDAVNAGESFGDSIEQLQKALGGMLNQAIAPLMPIMNDFVQTLIKLLPPLMSIIAPLLEKLAPVLMRLLSALLPPIMTILEAIMPLLNPLLDVLVLVVESALVPLIDFLSQILTAIMPPLTKVIRALLPVITPIVDTLKSLIDVVMPFFVTGLRLVAQVIQTVLIAAFNKAKPVIESIKSTFNTVINAVTKAFQGFEKTMTGIWDSIVKGIKGSINWLIGGINKFISFFNSIEIKVPKVKIPLIGEVGGFSLGLPNISPIPLLAEGGDINRSGAAVVGDAGPELLELPKGARVTPLNNSSDDGIRFERGAFEGAIIFDDYGVDRLMDRVISRLRGLAVNPG
jgi:phage-related protein